MVSFHDNPEQYDNAAIMDDLQQEMFACIAMNANLKEMEREITLHPGYIMKCQSSTKTTNRNKRARERETER